MKLLTVNGVVFYQAFMAGGMAIIKNKEHLNKINVFPVADADTGSNLAYTVQSIIDKSGSSKSLKDTMSDIADNAITYAKGNSGIIFAQYLLGLSKEMSENHEITVGEFALSAKNAVRYLYDCISEPVEGTMLTVIKDWAIALTNHSSRSNDFFVVLNLSFKDALISLNNTPKLLKQLAERKVLDAGAQGFVNFLEGILDYILNGCQVKEKIVNIEKNVEISNHLTDEPKYRYCCEAILRNTSMEILSLKAELKTQGESLILAGDKEKLHLHIHHNEPEQLFNYLEKNMQISHVKVDDMLTQFKIANNKKFAIGLITDTACDLPEVLIDKYQIYRIPFGINFSENFYLDKITMSSESFYKRLKIDRNHPKSSQPSPKTIETAFEFMQSHYKNVFSVHISKELSGIYNLCLNSAKIFSGIFPVNSKHLSVSLGLIVYRIALAIESGLDFDSIKDSVPEWIKKTTILTDINTLDYMVKGGRVSPLKGVLAKVLNLKPIVSVDESGKGIAFGKSFSRKSNMKKIINLAKILNEKNVLWNYALVHAQNPDRAESYAVKLTEIFNKKPLYVMPLSPVVGVHNGLGAVGIAFMLE